MLTQMPITIFATMSGLRESLMGLKYCQTTFMFYLCTENCMLNVCSCMLRTTALGREALRKMARVLSFASPIFKQAKGHEIKNLEILAFYIKNYLSMSNVSPPRK